MKHWLYLAWAVSILLAFIGGCAVTYFRVKRPRTPDYTRHRRRMKRWPLYAVSAMAVMLIGVRIKWPSKLDNTGLVLLGIATLSILVAVLPIKKIKLWEFEAEFDLELDKVEKKVTETIRTPDISIGDIKLKVEPLIDLNRKFSELEERDDKQVYIRYGGGLPKTDDVYDEYLALLSSPTSDVEKILAASALFEKTVARAGRAHGKSFRGGMRASLAELTRLGVLSKAEEHVFADIWKMRNELVHGGLTPTSEQTARFLDLLKTLMLRLSVETALNSSLNHKSPEPDA